MKLKAKGNSRKKPNPTNFSNLRSQRYLNQSYSIEDASVHESKLELSKYPLNKPHKRTTLNSSRLRDDTNKENVYRQIASGPQTSRANTKETQRVFREIFGSNLNCRRFSRLSPKVQPFDLVDTDLEDSFLSESTAKKTARHKSQDNKMPSVSLLLIVDKLCKPNKHRGHVVGNIRES